MSSGGDHLDPDRLESVDFPVVRRGYEPDLVRTQLVIVAHEIRRLRALVSELESEVAALEARPQVELEAQQITEAIGEEAVRVLEAARSAAAERAARAEAEAAALISGTERDAAEIRAQADAEGDRIIAAARTTADEVVEAGRERGRDMVAEAQTVRERMLRDLARKRQTHRAEVEQLRAGRDALLRSLADAQRSLDDCTTALVEAVPEAQAAAERAGLRVGSEPELTVEQLEAEIAAARLVGHPLLEGVADPGPDGDVGTDEPEAELGAGPGDGAGDVVTESPGVPLYDVEADVESVESEHEAGAGAGPDDGSDVEADVESVELVDVEADVESEHEAGGGAHPDDGSDVDDLFARLRSSREEAVSAAEAVLEADSDTERADDPDRSGPGTGTADATDEGAGGGDPEPDLIDVSGSDDDDPGSMARADAIEEISRSLQRLIVDEQGELLDGLRRDGVEAVRSLLDVDPSVPDSLAGPLRALVTAVAGDSAEVGTDEAIVTVRSLLLDPARSRLRDALEDTDDADELVATVRAVYRECRSRRVDEAASAAVKLVYESAIAERASTPA